MSELFYQPNVAPEYVCCHKSLLLIGLQIYIKSMKKYGIDWGFLLLTGFLTNLVITIVPPAAFFTEFSTPDFIKLIYRSLNE